MKKKILERIGIALYIIGLLALPFYKVYIDKPTNIDSIGAFLSTLFTFLLSLIGWWLLFTPFCWLIAALFWKDEDGKEVRQSCLVHILILLFPGLTAIVISKCSNEETPSSSFYSTYGNRRSVHSSSADSLELLDKTDDEVYICTSPQAKRYHRFSSCRGLNNCTYKVIVVGIDKAEETGKTPCGICY